MTWFFPLTLYCRSQRQIFALWTWDQKVKDVFSFCLFVRASRRSTQLWITSFLSSPPMTWTSESLLSTGRTWRPTAAALMRTTRCPCPAQPCRPSCNYWDYKILSEGPLPWCQTSRHSRTWPRPSCRGCSWRWQRPYREAPQWHWIRWESIQ